ncbi:MAG: response regulator [Ignavibacteria bacterium]|nr:response regulator [Ignavibacteria bacterium]
MITEKILVIDDETTVCDSVKKILSRKGYDVEKTADANEAIERIKKEKFDIVITDLMMPDVSGMELLELVKKYYPDIDVLVITGYATIESAVQATKLGATDYIQKPFTPSELTERVQRAVEMRKKRKEEKENLNKIVAGSKEVIDVDMPFVIEEIEKAASKDFVDKLSRSDIPLSKKYSVYLRCEKGNRECSIFNKTKRICKGECVEIRKEKQALLKKGSGIASYEGLIDVDMPFNIMQVESEIGCDYLDCMDRSDFPRAALYGKNSEARKNILVVDDEPVVCHSVRRILSKQNCTVEEAFDVEIAHSMIRNNKYDLIFLDLKMPKQDGMEVLSSIKENYPETPVIILTGYGTIDKAIEATKLGAHHFIPKPFTPDELKDVAMEVLA